MNGTAKNSNNPIVEVPAEYSKPESLRTLANYLLSGNGVKVRSGIQHEKRVDYFKGRRLLECILEGKKWPKSLPKIEDRAVAIEVANLLLQNHFFHRSEKLEGKKGHLAISKIQTFDASARFTWLVSGNKIWSHLGTGAVIAVVIGFTLLPIWPDVAKRVLWYCSVTFLIATLAFCLIRFLLFMVTWIFGYEFWVFPRLFDETLSFQDSFKPFYTFTKAPAGQGYYRIALIVATAAFVYWATTQPTEFDGFLKAQKDFIDDLYSGNLLADVAQDHKDNIDRIRSRVPKLDELMNDIDDEGDISSDKTENGEESDNSSTSTSTTTMFGSTDTEEDMDSDKFDDAMFEELLSRLPTDEEDAE